MELFLEEEVNKLVVKTLYQLTKVHTMLWKKEGHSEADLDELDRIIPELMENYSRCFKRFNSSDCRFPKFHYSLHLTSEIAEWGSLRVVDGCFGEVGYVRFYAISYVSIRFHEILCVSYRLFLYPGKKQGSENDSSPDEQAPQALRIINDET